MILAEPLGKEEWLLFREVLLSLEPCKNEPWKVSWSGSVNAEPERATRGLAENQNQVLKSGPVVCDSAGG